MTRSKLGAAICVFLTMAIVGLSTTQGQTANILSRPVSRVVSPVDNARRVTLRGNVHPNARPEFDRGLVDPQFPMNRMLLVLKRSDDQETALQAFMAQQQDPKSPNFHHWLSAAEFGATYGISDADLAKVTGWLQTEGFSLGAVGKGRGTIEFSGTAAQVQHSFHTEIHNYVVDGQAHTANNTDPQVPEALAPVVHGIASLHNFSPISQAVLRGHVKKDPTTGKFISTDAPTTTGPSARAIQPQFTYTGSAKMEDITPYDFATIYNVLPLWNAGFKGAGQTIAISGESSISLTDVATFQSTFGLPNNPPSIILNGPGNDSGAAIENTLDVEWAGAVAPLAKIVLVVSVSTSTTSGDLLSNQYIVDNQVASIMSTSFGTCELNIGTAGNAAYNQVWQQGAAEGISIFVASGDQGSAGCDNHNAQSPHASSQGLQVSGVASSPYVTAVGGTDFSWQAAEKANPGTYWSTTNDPVTGASAKSYIPETPWNQSCTNPYLGTIFTLETPPEKLCNDALNTSFANFIVTVGGSGGASSCTTSDGTTTASCTGGYPKPIWQVATGVPNDSHRDIPDVSLFAADGWPTDDGIPGSAYLICYSSTNHPCNALTNSSSQIEYQETGGTSVASPAMAGVMALVNEQTGSAQGLANPILYQLANAASCNSNTVTDGTGCDFYDTTSGTNAMPCITGSLNCITNTSGDQVGILSGYNTTTGYDLATGLGSVNVANLVKDWKAVAVPPTPGTIVVSPATVVSGEVGIPYSVQFSATGGSTFPYTFTALGAPDGLTMSPSGLLSGTPTVASTYLFKVTAADSTGAAAGGPFTGSEEVSLPIHAANSGAVPVITWNPSRTILFVHAPIGAGVLDATASVPGNFTYTASFGGQSPTPITATSELAEQNYTFTANFVPTDTVNNTVASATIMVSVTPQNVFVANSSGSISSLYPDGTALDATPVAGGGIGVARGESSTISSATLSGNALTTVTSLGKIIANNIGGGLVSPTALAGDSEGVIWITNANNSISEFVYGQAGLTPSTGYTGGGMSNPSGIAVDLAGNLWISNAGNNSVTEVIGVANPTAPIVNQLSLPGGP